MKALSGKVDAFSATERALVRVSFPADCSSYSPHFSATPKEKPGECHAFYHQRDLYF
jgi:hypothetical protein